MRRALSGALVFLLAAGCAPTYRPAATPTAQQDLDRVECRQRMESVGPAPVATGGLIGAFGLMSWRSRRQQVLDDCMTTKGYQR